MNTVADATSPIEIADRPWILGMILVVCAVTAIALLDEARKTGAPLLAAASAVTLLGCLFGARRAIRVSRLFLYPDGSARLSIHDRSGWRHRDFAAGTLRAGLQHHHDADGLSGRVMLLIDGPHGVQRIPFTGYFASTARARAQVARINAWREATATG